MATFQMSGFVNLFFIKQDRDINLRPVPLEDMIKKSPFSCPTTSIR